MQPKVALLTGTFGPEMQNGVGRFLVGLHQFSREREFGLDTFSAGDHLGNYPGVHDIHALAFDIPHFPAIKAFYPLEGRRRQLRRMIKKLGPDLVHLSTPDAIGATGLSIARSLALPVAAVYHTDFPAFAHQLVRAGLQRLVNEKQPVESLLAWGGPAVRQAQEEVLKHLTVMERFVLRRALHRNRTRLAELAARGVEGLANAAQAAVREIMYQFYSQCQLVIARSQVYERILVDDVGLSPGNVRTLRAGVDTQLFSPIKTPADQELRCRLGIPARARVVLYVGRVSDEKNIGFLAAAWRRFQEQSTLASETVLVVVGSGQLEEFHRLAGRQVFTVGPRFGTELSALYRLASVFWTAATAETLGQVVLEAQASGVPAIVAKAGASQENVTHAVTGLVLPAVAPEHWASALDRLLGDPPRLALYACNARQATADKTVAHSYEHFWQLHRELQQWELERQKYAVCGRLSIRVPDSLAPLPADAPGVRTTHLGDFHAGHGAETQVKARALRIIAERARERQADVYLHGDFTDTRPKLKDMLDELELFRHTFADAGVTPKSYLEGNHDYEFARAGRLGKMVGCAVEQSLVAVTESRLVVTHGHVSEIRELPALLRECRGVSSMLAALSVERLQARLKQSALEYDLTGALEDWFERAGLDGLEDWWRHILPQRQRMVDALRSALRKRGVDSHSLNALTHMIGSSNREQVLAQLCTALGGWGLVYGHTHEPHLTIVRVPGSGGTPARAILLGNSGSMRRKRLPPTWIETQGHTMELYAYDKTKDREVLVDRASVDPFRNEKAAEHAAKVRAQLAQLALPT